MAKISPAEFLRQVKQEVAKITWPTRQEAMQMSLFVIIFAAILAVFFLMVDGVSQALIAKILGV
ncbi:MAG: preprotein translocase subunit SecE [Alphaproteobacteria bacterium]|nr:preprotein translocase subunit SecE [Alphaproteobacteria bacterium]